MTLELQRFFFKSNALCSIPVNFSFGEGERQVKIKPPEIFSYCFVFESIIFLIFEKKIPLTFVGILNESDIIPTSMIYINST